MNQLLLKLQQQKSREIHPNQPRPHLKAQILVQVHQLRSHQVVRRIHLKQVQVQRAIYQLNPLKSNQVHQKIHRLVYLNKQQIAKRMTQKVVQKVLRL